MILPGSSVNLLQIKINPSGYKAGICIACDSYLNPHASPFLPKCTVSTLMGHQTKYVLNSNSDKSSSKGMSSPNNHLFINSLPYACDVRLDTGSPREILKKIKLIIPNRLIIGQLTINSLSNMLEHLKALIMGNMTFLLLLNLN